MAVSEIPAWKTHERGDLLASLIEFKGRAESLHDDAMAAYEEGWPATVVAWSAQRAWAQGAPDQFRAILHNHAVDTFSVLGSML